MLRKAILLIFFMWSVGMVSAQSSSVEQEFKERLERVGSKNKTIQCDFIQVKKVKNIRQLSKSNGCFFYDHSGRMALIYKQPAGDKIFMDGEVFTILVGGKKMTSKASTNPMMAQIAYMMQACMLGDVSKLGRGWKMSIERVEKGYDIQLTPTEKRIQKYIHGMFMSFSKEDLTLNLLRMEEATGGYTEYKFMNKQLNSVFDSTVFNVE